MNTAPLSTSLTISPSQLYVADLSVMRRFYSDYVGLEVVESSPSRVLLGDGAAGVIELLSKPKLTHANPREAGLFHNAILFSSRGELARSAGRIVESSPSSFSGTGDHLVSEAFYFNDPEGNGLELYYDRPKDNWTWVNGRVQMDTLYIDPYEFILKNASERTTSDKKLGHVHLRVGNITEARIFYVDTLGFDITATMPQALFVSVAGYHHHIGLNTWLSEGAGVRPKSLGLSDVVITLAGPSDINALAIRLEQRKYPFELLPEGLRVADPWGNFLKFI